MVSRCFTLAALGALALLRPAHGQGATAAPAAPAAPVAARASASASASANLSPLVKLLTVTNASTFSTTWAALQAAHLDQYLNNPALDVTFFAPTNEAWIKRLPTMLKPNYINVKDLFSEGKSHVLDPLLKYHMMQSVFQFDELTDQTRLSTLSNLCSYAKDLKVSASGASTYLISGGGSRGKILNRGMPAGNSMVYPVDDVLLPAVVTITLPHALETFTSGAQRLSPALARNSGFLDALQNTVNNQPLAPEAAPGAFLSSADLAQPAGAGANSAQPQDHGNSQSGAGANPDAGVDSGADTGAGASAGAARNAAPAKWATAAAGAAAGADAAPAAVSTTKTATAAAVTDWNTPASNAGRRLNF